ncbi:MAG: polysaccharide deacetylase family protein [Candidatus Zixiibacteriota bacterium]
MSESSSAPVKRMPSGLRRAAAKLFAVCMHCLGIWRLVYVVRRVVRRKPLLAVFTFHRIVADGADREHLVTYDKGTPAAVFDQQISGIKKFYEILALDQFIEVLEGKRTPARDSALITFDDADSEFAGQAFPALQKHSASSVVFVPTDFVDSPKKFWHLRVSNAFHRLSDSTWPLVKELSRQFPAGKSTWLEGLDYRKREDLATACWRFNIALDRMQEAEIEEFVDRLEAITGGEYTLGITTMSWIEIKEMHRCGVYMESHSASHRKLGRLDLETVRTELGSSKSMLERELGKTVCAICYPAGSFDERVVKSAEELGYRVGFTTRFGFIDFPTNGSDRFALTRFDMRGGDKFEIERFLGELPIRRFRKGWPVRGNSE